MTSYASLADLKLVTRIDDTDDDTLLQIALDAATDAIDDHCNRTFQVVVDVSTRSFEPDSKGRVDIDDIYSTDGLIISVRGTVVPAAVPYTSAGYVLYPRNAPALDEPYTEIRYDGGSWAGSSILPWPALWARSTVDISTSKWGFAASVPVIVRQACLLQASRWFSRRNSPYGIAGSPELGNELRLLAKLDADVAVMLSGKVRYR